MATKVFMEALSPTMEEGRLIAWHKLEGEPVKTGDVIAEVETDKAVMELVARGDGVLRARLLRAGDAAPVGQLVAVIAAPDEDISSLVGPSPTPATAVVASTLETAGTTAIPRTAAESQGEASTPALEQAPAVAGGPAMPPTAGRPVAPPADTRSSATGPRATSAARGSAVASTATPSPPGPGRSPGSPPDGTPPGHNGGRVRSSPLARRLASERGVDLDAVSGTGPSGRVVKRDIEAAERTTASPTPAARPAATPPAAGATVEGRTEPAGAPRIVPAEGDFHDVGLTQIRKTIAKRLAESIGPVPTFYLTAEFDLERVAEMRAAMIAQGEQYKVSLNDILLKAVATALAQHPEVNAHWLGDRIRHFNRVHLGMAVAVDGGLITPVLFDADAKGLRQIAEESRALAGRARARKLTPDEYTGSTFSVSNLGMFGIEQFTAIINPPEAGILAIGAAETRPVVVDGTVSVRRRVRVTMSCDHRVIDGATGARFLQTLRRLVENPLMLVY
jgi:pyruvate dehydrogenase E2 component (dihydrolipoyllysine-residue acetyltransferase)